VLAAGAAAEVTGSGPGPGLGLRSTNGSADAAGACRGWSCERCVANRATLAGAVFDAPVVELPNARRSSGAASRSSTVADGADAANRAAESAAISNVSGISVDARRWIGTARRGVAAEEGVSAGPPTSCGRSDCAGWTSDRCPMSGLAAAGGPPSGRVTAAAWPGGPTGAARGASASAGSLPGLGVSCVVAAAGVLCSVRSPISGACGCPASSEDVCAAGADGVLGAAGDGPRAGVADRATGRAPAARRWSNAGGSPAY
jgi:hypothetical protein